MDVGARHARRLLRRAFTLEMETAGVGDGDGDGGGCWSWRWRQRAWTLAPDTHDVADDAGHKRWRRGRLLLWRASAFATDALALETEAGVVVGGGRRRWRRQQRPQRRAMVEERVQEAKLCRFQLRSQTTREGKPGELAAHR